MYPWAVVVGTTLITTGLRFQLNSAICGTQLGVKPGWAAGSAAARRATLVEEAWLLAVSLLLLLASVDATASHNDACHFADTTACFKGWPEQVTSSQVENVMALTLGWYIHGIIKSLVPGIGLRSGRDMIAHHVLSVVCIALVSAVGITRFAVLLLSILNMSSPFMHLAKVIYYSGGQPSHRAAAFATFAAAFFASRLVLFPTLLYLNGVRAIVQFWGHGALLPGVAGLSLGTLLQGLQVFWFVKIMRILVSGKAEPGGKDTSLGGGHPIPQVVSGESLGPMAGVDASASPCVSGDQPTDSEGSSTQHLSTVTAFDRVRNDSAYGVVDSSVPGSAPAKKVL